MLRDFSASRMDQQHMPEKPTGEPLSRRRTSKYGKSEASDWLEGQIQTYLSHEKPIYEDFAKLVRHVLLHICRKACPYAMVSCRVKKVARSGLKT